MDRILIYSYLYPYFSVNMNPDIDIKGVFGLQSESESKRIGMEIGMVISLEAFGSLSKLELE